MPGDEQETVTRQDLTEFRAFLLEQLKSHTSELSSKFEKASTDAHCASSVSRQLNSRASSRFPILETKGTISSTLKFWIFSKAFRRHFLFKIQRMRLYF